MTALTAQEVFRSCNTCIIGTNLKLDRQLGRLGVLWVAPDVLLPRPVHPSRIPSLRSSAVLTSEAGNLQPAASISLATKGRQ